MRLFQRKSLMVSYAQLQDLRERLHDNSVQLVQLREEIHRNSQQLATIQTQVETLSRYLADIERKYNAFQSGYHWREYQEPLVPEDELGPVPEDQQQRLEWLKKKHARDIERRKKQGGL